MPTSRIEVLVEEPSMEAFLGVLLPRLLPRDRTFGLHPFQGKGDLQNKLEVRLRGYAEWLPEDWRIVVIVVLDNEDCLELKARLEAIAQRAGLRTRTSSGTPQWQLVNRIAIEELEAWYFGDWQAVRAAYPRVASTVPYRQGLRDSDAIAGGTWETFERVMRKHGCFKGGLPKIEAARAIAAHIDPARSRSRSFRILHAAIDEAMA